jgi:DNA-binding PadR family transcriptional regulator
MKWLLYVVVMAMGGGRGESQLTATLDRLEGKGLVKSKLGDTADERGGRAKKWFTITAAGARALEKSQLAMRHMLERLPARWNPSR